MYYIDISCADVDFHFTSNCVCKCKCYRKGMNILVACCSWEVVASTSFTGAFWIKGFF